MTDPLQLPSGLVWLNTSRRVDLRDVRGQIVIVSFWSLSDTRTVDRVREIEDMVRVRSNYAVTFLSIHTPRMDAEKVTDRVLDAVHRLGFQHPVGIDIEHTVRQSFGIKPTVDTIFLREDGALAAKLSKQESSAQIEAVLDAMLRSLPPVSSDQRQYPLLQDPPVFGGALCFPTAITSREDGLIAISDSGHHRVLLVNTNGEILDIIGTGERGIGLGMFDTARVSSPQGLAFDGDILYIADSAAHVVFSANVATRTLDLVAGTGLRAEKALEGRFDAKTVALSSPQDIKVRHDTLYIALAGTSQVVTVRHGTLTAPRIEPKDQTEEKLHQPSGIIVTDELFVIDSRVSAVFRCRRDGAVVERLGAKPQSSEIEEFRFQGCTKAALTPNEKELLITDTLNDSIRKINIKSGRLDTFFSFATGIGLRDPMGIAWSETKQAWLIADSGNHRIVELSTDGLRAQVFGLHEIDNAEISTTPIGSLGEGNIALTFRFILNHTHWRLSSRPPLASNISVLPEGGLELTPASQGVDGAITLTGLVPAITSPYLVQMALDVQVPVIHGETKEEANIDLPLEFTLLLAPGAPNGLDVEIEIPIN